MKKLKGFELKRCNICSEDLAAALFFKNGPTCRECSKRRRSEAHGWSVIKYDRVFNEQGGCCGICEKRTEDLVIDHDHRTGFRRGLLCSACNTGLGQFQDNSDILQKAVDYLVKGKANEFTEKLENFDKDQVSFASRNELEIL